jgi:hypothetical protein
MAHGLVEGRDGERVLPVVVEDEEVAGHDFMDAAKTSSNRWPGTTCQ